nr:hypothetical protein [uncultured Desulfobacter sp.]
MDILSFSPFRFDTTGTELFLFLNMNIINRNPSVTARIFVRNRIVQDVFCADIIIPATFINCVEHIPSGDRHRMGIIIFEFDYLTCAIFRETIF